MLTETDRDAGRFSRRQATLLASLACPQCARDLAIAASVIVDDAIAAANLNCDQHGRVGIVSDFRPVFHPADLAAAPDPENGDVVAVITRLDVGQMPKQGEWTPVAEGWRSDGMPGDSIAFETSGSDIQIELLGHSWGGIAEVTVDGQPPIEVDLYREAAEPVVVKIPTGLDLRSGSDVAAAKVSVVATGRGDGRAPAPQVIVTTVRTSVDPTSLTPPGNEAVNRGNPYPPRFLDLLATLGPDALIMDCGGGDRRLGDDRVINFEYLPYELPDVLGDGLCLPFADGTFDLVLSQAVLEHVPNPQRAIDEIHRVLRPGGTLYVEAAFMQPLHAVPSHYMNITPHGLQLLCAEFDTIAEGTFGGFHDTLGWLFRLVDAEAKVGPAPIEAVMATLGALDSQLSPDELRSLASAVWMHAVKRPEPPR